MKSSSYKYYTHLFKLLKTINHFIVLACLYLFWGNKKKLNAPFYNLKSTVAAKFIWQALNITLNLSNKFGGYEKRIHNQPIRHNAFFSALHKNKIKPLLQIPHSLSPSFSCTQTIYQAKATEVGIKNYCQHSDLIGGITVLGFNLNNWEDFRRNIESQKNILYTSFYSKLFRMKELPE